LNKPHPASSEEKSLSPALSRGEGVGNITWLYKVLSFGEDLGSP